MNFSTVSEWLSWIASLHPKEMDLGLERVKEVANRLAVLKPPCPVIIVGGTNGKGSTVAGLEAIYLASGYHVGAFTSPYLFKHNEQVRIDQHFASDLEFCTAFTKVNEARGDISLTSFEFFTLAALLIFQQYSLDVILLEVGLGGRLDAVNIIDADVSVITSISIDHTDWLGDTREKIAHEKAGIFRKDKPAICGDPHPPQSLKQFANTQEAVWYCQNQDFHYEMTGQDWSWSCAKTNTHYDHLPLNHLATQNMATVIMVITLLQARLPVTRQGINEGLSNVFLAGRVQVINTPMTEIYDVSHNPASLAHLAHQLKILPCSGKTCAVFSMLADKDIVESIIAIHDAIDVWYVAPLFVKRAALKEKLVQAFQLANIKNVSFFASLEAAYDAAKAKTTNHDRIVICGSFHTVSNVWQHSGKK